MRPSIMFRSGVVLLALAGPFCSHASAQKGVYFISESREEIGRANLDGSDQQVLVTGLQRSLCLAVDPIGGKIYWGDSDADKLQRANLDGSGVEDIGTAIDPRAIDVDALHGKVYWTDWGDVHRADLDGANPEVVVEAGGAHGVAVDPVNAKLYWTAPVANEIRQADLDGSNPETLLTPGSLLGAPHHIELDVAGGKMYWTSNDLYTEPYPRLCRADLDGENEELLHGLFGGFWSIDNIALDLTAGKLYWVEQHNTAETNYRRSNLDGSQMEDLLLLDAHGIDLLVVPDIPAVSTWGLVIMAIFAVTAGTVLGRYRHSEPAA